MFDDLRPYLDEKGDYARKLGEDGEPTEAIEDKSMFHLMDAERVLGTHLFRPAGERRSAGSRQG